MDLSGIEYLGFHRIMDRGTAEVIEKTDDVLFLHDPVSEVNFLAGATDEAAIEALDRHADCEFILITTTNKGAAEYAQEKYGYKNLLECYQYAYTGEMPEPDPRLTLKVADLSDLETITEVYDLLDPEEVSKIIERDCVVMAYDQEGSLVGFIGEHLEGSLGMLFVFPEHRRKGYAEALEYASFRWTMEKGQIPFGQVVSDNYPSLELQKKMGLAIADKPVYWTW